MVGVVVVVGDRGTGSWERGGLFVLMLFLRLLGDSVVLNNFNCRNL